MITFPDRKVHFYRPFSLDPGATISPKGPLHYRVPPDQSSLCQIVNDHLTMGEPRSPLLPRTCTIEAYAPASPGRVAAEPKRAAISVGFPDFQVSVVPVPKVSWSKLRTKVVTVTVRENSGSAYYISVDLTWPRQGSEKCHSGRDPASQSDSSAPGTTAYHVSVALDDPAGVSYTCQMVARAGPVDIASGKVTDNFTITVDP